MNLVEEKIKSKKLIYLLSFFIISFTFQNIFKPTDLKLWIIIFFFGLFIFYLREVNIKFVQSFIAISLVIILQGYFFSYSPMTHFTSVYFNLFMVFVLLKILPFNYHYYIIKVILVLSVISFILWIAVNLSSAIHNAIPVIANNFNLDPIDTDNILAGDKEQIIIFTYEKGKVYGIIRNAGFCHEPGAYGVCLIYAIIFGVFLDKKLFTKRNVFFLICLISTLSTANFLALFFILMFYLLHTSRTQMSNNLILASVFVGLAIAIVPTFDFMNSKINEEVESQMNANLTQGTSGRILGARKAVYVIGKYPLFGRGFTTASKVRDLESAEAAGYGFFTYASQVGIIVFIITIILFKRTLFFWGSKSGFKKKEVIVLSLAFIPILFSQAFIPSPLFNMLILESFYRNYKLIKFT